MKSPIRVRQNLKMAGLAALLVLSAGLGANAADSSEAQFNRALVLAGQNKTKVAEQIIDRLLENKKSTIAKDRLLMTKARLLFQEGDVQGAIEVYQKVPSLSDYWMESLEERGWAHLRVGEYGQALAQIKTLKAPMFATQIGPEPFFLEGLVKLRICDYPGIFETLKGFKKSYRDRIVAIQNLAKTGRSEEATKAVAKLKSGQMAWQTVAPETGKLPRYFYRDAEFMRRMQDIKAGRSDENAAYIRLKQLASRDLEEISEILKKMQLLEAEVIQRIFLADKPKGRANRNVDIGKGEEVLVFEDTGEFWLDELDNYQVKVQGCPSDLTQKSQKTASGGQ